ncbi:ABC transporter permease [Nonomuraea zeae]|uniref:ABC transporter permease n=1 Tax=Nonomuraea zeae TaxID=1642303 RepID=A0A5S4GGC2_9ACTN|nr:ABC transporter permease [Nonomuraea zeae]
MHRTGERPPPPSRPHPRSHRRSGGRILWRSPRTSYGAGRQCLADVRRSIRKRILTRGVAVPSVCHIGARKKGVQVTGHGRGVPAVPATLVALLTGTVIGLGNGFVTVVLKVPSFVTTLGTFYLVTGIVLTTSGAYPAEIPASVDNQIGQVLGAAGWAHLVWALVIVAFFHVLFTRTRWGLHTIAVGGNLLGAREAGVRTGRIKIGNFMIAGTLGAFAGILEAFRIHTIDPNLGGGTGLMFTAVSAAVIGGTALAGGSGTIVGGALGALVLAELQDGFNLIGISANPYFLILGGAILLAMIANVYLSRLRRAGKTT